MAPSPNYKQIAYLTFSQDLWELYILHNNYFAQQYRRIRLPKVASELQQQKEKQKKQQRELQPEPESGADKRIDRPSAMCWCSEDCVCIMFQQGMLMVGRDENSIFKLEFSRRSFVFREEIDGIRVITNKKNQILRRLPEYYLSVFSKFSTQPASLLYEAYCSYEDSNPLQNEELRNQKEELERGIVDCLNAGAFEINPLYQSRLLKAAIYGKSYLRSEDFDHNMVSEVCKKLRVLFSLRQDVCQRHMTYEQLSAVLASNESELIQLLLRYNLHYKAIEVCSYMNFQIKLRSQIFVHWACQKLYAKESNERLYAKIKEKLSKEKNIPYCQIAQHAMEIGKSELALKLLELEPVIGKQIPLLLWMAKDKSAEQLKYYDLAIELSVKVKDSNLINLIIMNVLKSDLDDKMKFYLLHSKPTVREHLKQYLRQYNIELLQAYNHSMKNSQDNAFSLVEQAYQCKKIDQRKKYLEKALWEFQQDAATDQFYIQSIKYEITLIEDFLQKNPILAAKQSTGDEYFQEISINNILETFLRAGEIKDAANFQRMLGANDPSMQITDKQFGITYARILVEQKKYTDLETYIAQKNKRAQLIPYDIVADLLLKAGQREKAVQMLQKMPNLEDKVQLLIRIGEPKTAINVTIHAKNTPMLQKLREQINDAALGQYIDDYFKSLKQNK